MSSPLMSPSSDTITEYQLTGGPRWYRSRIRTLGPFLALLIPGTIGIAAYLSLRISDSTWSGAVGLIGGYLGAPLLLAVGAPFGERSLYPVAVVASVVLWLLIGMLAARRATRNPFATWADFWRHYGWMLLGIWVGVAGALVVATVRIGSGIVDW
ncbi:MAG: hypothetical protein AAGD33_10400 [Actinomycetota bacterium]